MYRIQYDRYPDDPDNVILPCDYFDLCGGSDAGGIIVIMLIKLRMSVEETSTEFGEMCRHVYEPANLTAGERTRRLRAYLEDLLARKDVPLDAKLCDSVKSSGLDFSDDPPRFVLARPRSNLQSFSTFRTYHIRAERTISISVIDATLATCAAHPSFLPVAVGPEGRRTEYIGTTLGVNNPIRQVISEAHALFGGDTFVASLVSLGAGEQRTISIPENASTQELTIALQSMVADCERVANEAAIQMGNLGIYSRFSVKQGFQAGYISLATIYSATSDYLDDPEVSSKLEQCITSLEIRQGLTTLEQLKYSGGGRVVHKSFPPITANYVERHEPWNIMIQALIELKSDDNQKLLVISGLGGCGKSTLVTRFASEYQSRFDYFFFIDATSEWTIRADLVQSVRSISPQYSQVTFDGALSFFTSPRSKKWALIYDNADDVSLRLASLLPSANHGVILVTTRNRSLAQITSGVHLELDVMSKSEAVEVLVRSSKREKNRDDISSLEELAAEVGYLPVALVQAGCYMFQTGCSAEEYIHVLRKHRKDLMGTAATGQRDKSHRSAYSAFDMSYEKLSPQLRDFLHLISFFHPANLPSAIISFAAKADFRLKPVDLGEQGDLFEGSIEFLRSVFCPSGSWQDRTLHQILADLQNYSLISHGFAYGTTLIRTHPLIHSWANDRIPLERVRLIKTAACRLLACACADGALEGHLMAHIDALISTPDHIALDDQATFAQKTRAMDRFTEAETMWQRIYKEVLKLHGSSSLFVATAALGWADTLVSNLDEMRNLETNAIEIFITLLGPCNPQTLKATMCLAATCWRQGHYSEAEALERQVLENCLKELGENDDVTTDAKAALSSTLRSIGRFEESERLQREVLQYRIRVYGESHPAVMDSMSELACLEMYQGRFEKAENIFRTVIEKQQASLGKEHPASIGALSALSLVLMKQNKLKEAEEIQRWLLQVEKRGGQSRPSFIQSMANLAQTLFRMKKYADASKFQRHVLRAQIRALGNHHPQTLNTLLYLVDIYQAQGRLAKCHILLSTTYIEIRSHYGRSHPETLKIMQGLSRFYLRARQFTKAARYGRYSLLKMYEKMGAMHPNTLNFARNLLSIYRSRGHHRLAFFLLLKWVQASFQERGESAEGTKESIMELGLTLFTLKRYRDAEKIQTYALEQALQSSSGKIKACWREVKHLSATFDAQRLYCKAKTLRKGLFASWDPQSNPKDYLRLQIDQYNTLHKMGLKKEAILQLDCIIGCASTLKSMVQIVHMAEKQRKPSPRQLRDFEDVEGSSIQAKRNTFES
ncbi:hypothetical protein FRC17_006647 [Serendipita sp. 399]|nr:hypothetical protein FRC17_006647 [Serendipita sp. 399]